MMTPPVFCAISKAMADLPLAVAPAMITMEGCMAKHGSNELDKKAIAYLKDHAVYVMHSNVDARGNITDEKSASLFVDFDPRYLSSRTDRQNINDFLTKFGVLAVPPVTDNTSVVIPITNPEATKILDTIRKRSLEYNHITDEELYNTHKRSFIVPALSRHGLGAKQIELFANVSKQIPTLTLTDDYVKDRFGEFTFHHQQLLPLFSKHSMPPYTSIKGEAEKLPANQRELIHRFVAEDENPYSPHVSKYEACRLLTPDEMVKNLATTREVQRWVQELQMGILEKDTYVDIQLPTGERGL